MRRNLFISLLAAVFFTMASSSLAASVLNVEVETGAMKDQARAVTKPAQGLVSITDSLHQVSICCGTGSFGYL